MTLNRTSCARLGGGLWAVAEAPCTRDFRSACGGIRDRGRRGAGWGPERRRSFLTLPRAEVAAGLTASLSVASARFHHISSHPASWTYKGRGNAHHNHLSRMHRLEIIHADKSPEPVIARTFSASWRRRQFQRARAGANDFWFETFDDEQFGRSIVMVGDLEHVHMHLRRPKPLPQIGAGQALALVYLNWPVVEARFRAFALDFGCSPAVVRTLVALLRTCDVRLAARTMGISYETAREQLDSARATVGAKNLTRLVTLIGLGIGQTGEDGEECDQLLAAAYNLSGRQVKIAATIADGATRNAVANTHNISEAVVKKELARIFEATGVSNAIALARALVELRLLAIYANLSATRHLAGEPAAEVLSVAVRRGRTIVASDYGPASGRPVLVLHSSMTTRHVNSGLVYALQSEGYRPISIDRPGFGDTDAAPSACVGQDFLDLAARDIVDFCAARRWRQIPLVSRGAAQIVMALHHIRPDLIAAAVIMNPDPDAQSSTKETGFIATMKKNFARRPWAVGIMSRWVVKSMTFERVRDHVHRAAAGCDADARAMGEPRNIGDYYRALVDFRRGKLDGFIKEQGALATTGKPNHVRGTPHFALLIGEGDSLHDPKETLQYWRDVLPDADVSIVSGTGRFMSYSHPEIAVNALARMLANPILQSRGACQ